MSRAPRQLGPPAARVLSHFYDTVFTDTSVFFKPCQSLSQFASVVTVEMQLQKISKQSQSMLHPAGLPPEVIEGHGQILNRIF